MIRDLLCKSNQLDISGHVCNLLSLLTAKGDVMSAASEALQELERRQLLQLSIARTCKRQDDRSRLLSVSGQVRQMGEGLY